MIVVATTVGSIVCGLASGHREVMCNANKLRGAHQASSIVPIDSEVKLIADCCLKFLRFVATTATTAAKTLVAAERKQFNDNLIAR